MAGITAAQVKELREKTGSGFMDCKKALVETGGDMDKAIEFLRKKGLADAGKRMGRVASEGTVHAYIHGGGRIGVLVEVNCETDFVARTDDFQTLVKDIAMHIAATNPLYVRREDVPESVQAKEKEIYAAQARATGKPEKVIERIVAGKLEKYFKENCLLEQPFVKDTDKTVLDYVKETIAKTGENISVRRFVRYHLGEGLEKRADDFASEVAEQAGLAT